MRTIAVAAELVGPLDDVELGAVVVRLGELRAARVLGSAALIP